MTTCSVIVPVYGKANLTRQCVDRLLALSGTGVPFELIVVDDGSRDGGQTQRLLAGYGDRIRVVTHDTNKFFATACNSGAAVARGDYLVFLNNDTVPFPGWLDALVRYAAARPTVGIVGPKLLFPDGTIQHAGLAVCQDSQPRHLYVGFPGDHPAVNKARSMQMVSGACHLLPRAVYDRTGGYDPLFINGYEDVDLCLRVRELGYDIHYCPDSVLVHLEGVSEGRHRHEAASGQAFHRRWAGKLRADDIGYYVADGLMHFEYAVNHLAIRVSPLLGTVTGGAWAAGADEVLAGRAAQVYELIRENVGLRAASHAPVPLPPAVAVAAGF